MKTVFNSNSELAHVWANQLQYEGRGNSMFFYGPVIYSYGNHYEIARFVTAPNGQSVCFVNSNGYSNSTAKHTNHVWNAIPDGVLVFKVPFISGVAGCWHRQSHFIETSRLDKVIESMLIQCRNLVYDQLNAVSRFHAFYQANNLFQDIQEICTLFDLDIPAKPENWDKAKEKADYLRSTQGEREKSKELKKLEKSQGLLSKWLNHEFNGELYDIPVRLRLSKDGKQIETTKGAKVGLESALRLLAKIQANENVKGEKIEGFTLIESTLDYVKIGCHVIAWPVINQVFNKAN